MEAEPRAGPRAELHGAEVARVVVDPPAFHASHPRDVASAYEPFRSLVRQLEPRSQALGDPLGDPVGDPVGEPVQELLVVC